MIYWEKYRYVLFMLLTWFVIACEYEPDEIAKSDVEMKSSEQDTVAEIDLDSILKRDTLKAITAYSSTSYFIYRGQPMGYEYELLLQFADELGVELEIVIADDLGDMFQLLKEGKGDLIAHGLTITKSRKEHVSFSRPLMSTRQVLIQRKPDNWRGLKSHQIEQALIREPIELAGKSVHVGSSSAFRDRLINLSEEIGEDIHVVSYKNKASSEELIKMVADDKINYTMSDEHVAKLNATFTPNIDGNTPLSFKQQVAWATRPESSDLLTALNNWIERVENTSDYAFVYNRYFKHRKDISRRIKSAYYAQGTGNISPYDALIKQYADSIGWDWRLLASQVYQESRFNPAATSWAGAQGLMQLMPATARAVDVSDPMNPAASIEGGVEYLKELDQFWQEIDDKNERIKFILASYNAGPYHVRDAQRLALKYGYNPCEWSDNVALFLQQKAKPRYYNDPVAKYGYCRGSEPVKYVEEILKRHARYAQILNS